eukprot:CAMPEP_0201659588 /NCGR_PEP_ID=MMETSP0494-20130426/2379_1 /ASSEMBLY_ACC=CAM_ASM_000839 /TAXON_ID=420259 /ORGANISM="Thalassiosira gravida, Strain GMp14c1" /LENGTH=617 /DNA_ID=CAMNT_0048137145 /DNA_START=150 /DNA_END=2003 /DNA_ORIENTATION=+
MPEKKSRSFRLHSEDDRATTVVQRANVSRKRLQHQNIVTTSLILFIVIFFIYPPDIVRVGCSAQAAARVDGTNINEDGSFCNDADFSNDASCVTSSNEDAYKGSNTVPMECSLVLAPSGIPNSGWGTFTLTSRKRGQRIMDQGDIIIHIPDPDPHSAHKMKRLVWGYLWDGQETGGHYEGTRVMTASNGFGFLSNGLPRNPSIIVNNDDNSNNVLPSVDDGGLSRGKSPGAGAITHHHNRTWNAAKDLEVGDEVFIAYGPGWFKERGFEVDVSPRKWDVSHLREVGYCLDNMIIGPSLIEEAGRGAFASRDLEGGAVVAPVPLISLSRLSMSMVKERKDGSLVVSTQLLQNYCFGHANSSLLLYPYSHGINFVNHNSSPNVKLRWWEGSVAFFDKPILELQQLSTSQIMLELVATRPIEKGEEIVLDYGEDWAKAWNDHVEVWQPKEEDIWQLSSEKMNADEKFLIIRTQQEQQSNPYPVDVFTSCFYQYSEFAEDEAPAAPNPHPLQSVAKWKQGMIASRNLRPCIVVKREEVATNSNDDPKTDQSYQYTVHVVNRPTLDEAERIPKGHMHFVTHVPRSAIIFSDKLYTSDQHLENAFRSEIGLGDLFPPQWKDLL